MSVKAVILAAGMGTRLGEHASGMPKCLVEVGGSSLLERSLNNLSACGITDVVIVLGFRGDMIKRLIGSEYAGMTIAYAENPRFDTTGNMYSLAQAEHLLDTATLILEADLIYERRAISRLLAAPERNAILVARLLHHGDDVYIVSDKRGRLVYLGKDPEKQPDAVGALLGISKYSPEFMNALFETARSDFARGDVNRHYEETVLDTAKSGQPVHTLVCHDIHWTEIDNVDDLLRAREEVYPEIRAREDRDAASG